VSAVNLTKTGLSLLCDMHEGICRHGVDRAEHMVLTTDKTFFVYGCLKHRMLYSRHKIVHILFFLSTCQEIKDSISGTPFRKLGFL